MPQVMGTATVMAMDIEHKIGKLEVTPIMNLLKKSTAKRKRPTVTADNANLQKNLLWEGMNFAATEAYNLLRTNLLLSFADEEGARLIGVTSTEHAEGKSLTSINLSAALAKANHKTLLLECDLRLPSVAKYLHVNAQSGLSEVLTGIVSGVNSCIYDVQECENLSVLFCGRTPPNPSELLGSKRMDTLLKELSKQYEYIVVDLPPVGEVPDALVLAKKLSGMILVVRNDITTQPQLADVIRQMRYTGARILGFVYNGADTSAHGYGKKYKKYAKYGYGDYAQKGSQSNRKRK